MIDVFLYLAFSFVQKTFQSSDGFGGIFASQVIRLIGNIYSQTIHVYICGELYRIFVDINQPNFED
jgi:hypothetical protein